MPRAGGSHHFLEGHTVIRMCVIIGDSPVKFRLLFIGQWVPSEVLVHHRLKQTVAILLREGTHGIKGLVKGHRSAPGTEPFFRRNSTKSMTC